VVGVGALSLAGFWGEVQCNVMATADFNTLKNKEFQLKTMR